jgi:hypothetical protein
MVSNPRVPSRRALLRQSAAGFGFLGLQGLLAGQSTSPLSGKVPHLPARVKRVIFLFMHGGPSSIDTFDPKSQLDRITASRYLSSAASPSARTMFAAS